MIYRYAYPLKVSFVFVFSQFFLLLCFISSGYSAVKEESRFVFDDSLLSGFGSTIGSLSAFATTQSLLPGEYLVDLYINKIYFGQRLIEFQSVEQQALSPCFHQELVNSFGIYPKYLKKIDREFMCLPIKDYVNDTTVHFDSSRFRLEISIPQAYLKQLPRDYIPPETWQKGETMAFFNYQWNNYYSTKGRYSSYFRLQSGMNWDLWRVQHQSKYHYSQKSTAEWSHEKLTFTRILPSLHSELVLWENQTSGIFFPSIFYRGIQLIYDERMLSNRLQGYAPTVRGIALTNARVIIQQAGRVIYDENVPAGPFEINDLYPNAVNGDLFVKIIETDQRTSSFVVPFSALPNSLRENQIRYFLTTGALKPYQDKNYFFDGATQYGVNNLLTMNLAGQFAKNYYALQLGNIYNTSLGALGVSVTLRRMKSDASYYHSWLGRLSYSRSLLSSGLNVSVVGSHHFSPYRFELANIAKFRKMQQRDNTFHSFYRFSRSRLEMAMNKSFANYGTLIISNTLDWFSKGGKPDSQFSFTYNNSWNDVLYGMTISQMNKMNKKENLLLLTFSMPLNKQSYSTMYRQNMVNHSRLGAGIQSSLTGTLDSEKTLSYSLNTNKNDKYQKIGLGGTLQKKFSNVYINSSYAYYNQHHASSLSAQGSVVIHRNGVTFGPVLGNTFALVDAPGASGVRIMNYPEARIDKQGFALIPSLTPYRKNSILLDVDNQNNWVDILESKTYVTPYTGAAIRVKFKTEVGYPLLINLSHPLLAQIPLTANVYNEKNQWVTIVGQGSQLYFRTDKDSGTLVVKWGSHHSQQCSFRYQLSDITADKPIYQLQLPCEPLSSTPDNGRN